MNHIEKNKKLITIIFVVSIISIVTLTVVYAALSASLTISGSADVVASTWSVYVTNGTFTTTIPSTSTGNDGPIGHGSSNTYNSYKVTPLAAGHSCSGQTDCIDPFQGTGGSFTTAPLSKPGDFKAIKFDVVNGGTIDAKLDSVILNGISTAQDVYLNYYALYSDGKTPASGDVLTAGSTKSMVLVIEFDETTTSSQLPTSTQSLNLSFVLNYVQN